MNHPSQGHFLLQIAVNSIRKFVVHFKFNGNDVMMLTFEESTNRDFAKCALLLDDDWRVIYNIETICGTSLF